MQRGLIAGAIAGAVGTLALDLVSYVDMFVQGRPASRLPAEAAGLLAERLGFDLGRPDDDATANRASALGAVLGYGTGVAAGAVFGLWTRSRRRTRLRTALLLGGGVMAAANGPMVAQGLTDPRHWGTRGWISDIVPHAAYGLVTAAVLDRIATS